MNTRQHAEAATQSLQSMAKAAVREHSLRRIAAAGLAFAVLSTISVTGNAAGRSANSSFNVSATVVRTCAIRAETGASAMTVDASSRTSAGMRSGCTSDSSAVLALEAPALGAIAQGTDAVDGKTATLKSVSTHAVEGVSANGFRPVAFEMSSSAALAGLPTNERAVTNKRATSGSMTVRNPGTSPMVIRVAVQSGNASTPEAGRAGLLASPASFTIPAGGAQIIRVLLPAASDARQSHSLVLHDVSQLAATGQVSDMKDVPSIVVPVVFGGNEIALTAGWIALASR